MAIALASTLALALARALLPGARRWQVRRDSRRRHLQAAALLRLPWRLLLLLLVLVFLFLLLLLPGARRWQRCDCYGFFSCFYPYPYPYSCLVRAGGGARGGAGPLERRVRAAAGL